MGTYTVGSPEYAAACERAEEQIRDDLKAGAVEQYIDGESAQQYLGELIRLNFLRREIGEDVKDWIARIGAGLDVCIMNIVDRAVENNVARVAQENAE
jgi:hypothetical protein